MKSIVYRTSSQLRLGLCIVAMLLVQTSLPAAEPSEAEIKALIEQLASPNKAPKTYAENKRIFEAEYPPGFDYSTTRDIYGAYSKLRSLGPRAYAKVIEHADDERYSLTGDTGVVDENLSVGFLCRRILHDQISPFEPEVAGENYTRGKAHDTITLGPRGHAPLRPNFVEHLLKDRKAGIKWAEEHKSTELWIIQLETLKWMISQETKEPAIYELIECQTLQALLRELKGSGVVLVKQGHFFAK